MSGIFSVGVRRFERTMLACALAGWLVSATLAADPGVIKSEFIYERAPFASCHASTIVETPSGLVASWFGGSDEGNADVSIWVSRAENGAWTVPVEVNNGSDDGQRYPCWNPVLFQSPGGPLLLFHKVGPNPKKWWGVMLSSDDGGKSWSKPKRLPEGILGPIKNKPVLLKNGDLLCPSSTEHDGWQVHMEIEQVHMERTTDLGKSWSKTASLNDGKQLAAIQPTVLRQPDGKLQILCRTRQQRIYESWSADEGKTWSPMAATSLPNPNSGIDAVNLPDGRSLLVYNHTPPGDRSPLNVAVSSDGKKWQAAAVLETEPGEFSYPAVIVASDGLVHATYTWKREKIRHVVIDTAKLRLRDFENGMWPK